MGGRGQNRLYSENKDYTYLQGSRKDMVMDSKLNVNPGKEYKTTPFFLTSLYTPTLAFAT